MYVRRFLARLETGDVSDRVDVVTSLATLFIDPSLVDDHRQQVITALLAVLDDPSARVRRAMAEVLGRAAHVPQMILHALCEDTAEVAAPVLTHSMSLSEGWFIDMTGAGEEGHRVAIARRPQISVPLAAALAEIGDVPSCLTLLANPGAKLARSSLARMVERHRGDPRLRSVLLARTDLPPMLRHRLMGGLSDALGTMIAEKGWLPNPRAARLMRDVQETATLHVTEDVDHASATELAERIHADGQLTVTLLLRCLVRGQTTFFEAAMCVLSKLPLKRTIALLEQRDASVFRTLYARTDLPEDGCGALWAALDVIIDIETGMSEADTCGRRIVERVLSRYETLCGDETDAFYALLTRFAADEARAQARETVGGYFRNEISPVAA